MNDLSPDDIARLVSGLVAVVLMTLLTRYFLRSDARQKAVQQAAVTSMHVVTGWQREDSRLMVLLQTAAMAVLYLYMIIIWPLLIVTSLWLLPEPSSVLQIIVYLVGSLKLVPTIFVLFTLMLGIRLFDSRPLIPNMLFSRQYSLVRDMYIDERGFEGAFALPWSRVRTLYRINERTFRLTYRRFPSLFTRLIKADTITLSCPTRADVDEIINYWYSSR